MSRRSRTLEFPADRSILPPLFHFRRSTSFDLAEQNTDKPPFYNECITVFRTGSLDVQALERSLTEIIRRHEIWRTTYDTVDGRPVQVIHPAPGNLALPTLDFSGLPESEQELKMLRCVAELTQRPFDLRRGPLLRFHLVKTGEFAHRLFLIAHQSIVDGVSAYQVFPTELAALYEAFTEGNPSPLPELSIQFADYAEWQRHELDANKLDAHLNYWRRRLGGAAANAPLACQRPPKEDKELSRNRPSIRFFKRSHCSSAINSATGRRYTVHDSPFRICFIALSLYDARRYFAGHSFSGRSTTNRIAKTFRILSKPGGATI